MPKLLPKTLATIFVLLLLISSAIADDRMLSPAELKEDLKVALAALNEVHPALYAHIPPAKFNKRVSDIARSIRQPLTSLQFFRTIAPLLAQVHCYHTWVLPSADDLQHFEKDTRVLPLDVVVGPNGVFVRKDVGSGAQISPGTRVLKIGNRDVHSAVAALLENYDLGIDGIGMSPRYAKLSRPAYFARVFSLYFQDSEPATITVIEPGARTAKRVSITPMKAADLSKALAPAGSQLNLIFFDATSTAILTVASFEENPTFFGFLRRSFEQLRDHHTKNLIIDLRNNGGGEDLNSILLYSYIAVRPFRYYSSLISNSDAFEAARHDPAFPTDAFRDRAIPSRSGEFQVKQSAHPGLRLQQPSPLHFQGSIYCLVNGLTGSAASEFSAVAYSAGRATFIGEETGGGYLFDTSGPQVRVTLPHSSVRIVVPTVKYNLAVANAFQNRGLIPQVRISSNLADLVSGDDRVMKYTLGLIAERGSEKKTKPHAMAASTHQRRQLVTNRLASRGLLRPWYS